MCQRGSHKRNKEKYTELHENENIPYQNVRSGA